MSYIDKIADRINATMDAAPLSDEWRPLFRIYAVLALVKGTGTTLEDVHDAWSAFTAGTRPDHRSLIPFDELTEEVQLLDAPYRDAIHAVARELSPLGRDESSRITRLRNAVMTLQEGYAGEYGNRPDTVEEIEASDWLGLQSGDMTEAV